MNSIQYIKFECKENLHLSLNDLSHVLNDKYVQFEVPVEVPFLGRKIIIIPVIVLPNEGIVNDKTILEVDIVKQKMLNKENIILLPPVSPFKSTLFLIKDNCFKFEIMEPGWKHISVAQLLLEKSFLFSAEKLLIKNLELLDVKTIPYESRKKVFHFLYNKISILSDLKTVFGTFRVYSNQEEKESETLQKLRSKFDHVITIDDSQMKGNNNNNLLFNNLNFWDKLIGYDKVKHSLDRLVRWRWYKKDHLTKMGINSGSNGILLYGPSGCGKTYISQLLGQEEGIHFFPIRASEIFSKWFGESEKILREIFAKARMQTPCILFLDELDSLAPSRKYAQEEQGVEARVLSTLLNELDGVDTNNEDMIVLAATSRIDAIDEAVLRPGRLGSRIEIGLPNTDDRYLLFHHFLAKTPLDSGINFDTLVKNSIGLSVSQIESICSIACFRALREDCESVKQEHFLGGNV